MYLPGEGLRPVHIEVGQVTGVGWFTGVGWLVQDLNGF